MKFLQGSAFARGVMWANYMSSWNKFCLLYDWLPKIENIG